MNQLFLKIIPFLFWTQKFQKNIYKISVILAHGCANGKFFKYLINECNIDANAIDGIDVESDILEICRTKSPNFYSINQTHLIEKRFDLITMWNVIEHIYELKKIIKSLKNLLKDDDEFFIEIPMYGTLAEKLGDKWSHYIITEHINLFSRAAIINLGAVLDN